MGLQMTRSALLAVFIAIAAFAFVRPAYAQATNDADAKTAQLEAQIEALQAQIDELRKQVKQITPSWRGAPTFIDEEAGWTFKVRGRVQFDAAYIDAPANFPNRNLGFNTRARRLRLGAEGAVPGGFRYKVDFEFANAEVNFGEVAFNYSPNNAPVSVLIGNQQTLGGIDLLTNANFASFIERAQVNDAFLNVRRIGVSVGYASENGLLRFRAGAFSAHSIDASFDNDGYIFAARGIYTPPALSGFLHLGVNAQYRQFQSNNNGVASISDGAPSTNQIARYRALPFLQTTNVRFVDTGNFAAKSDIILGVEAYGMFKSLHIGGEAQYLKANAYRAGDVATGLDAFAGGATVTPTGDPSFFSGYFEVGYFLTGESRGYTEGIFNRTTVLKPLDKGGAGAFQIIGRIDYLDLDSARLKNGRTNMFATGVSTLEDVSVRLGRGGKQTGYLAGLIWIPTDYVRFLVNYIHTEIEGGPLAATTLPLSTRPVDKRRFSTDALAVRAQLDF